MPKTDFRAIQLKIARARQHYKALLKEIEAYLATRPYTIDTRRENSRRVTYFISELKAIPTDIPVILGDVISNLRSSLDHLAYQLVMQSSCEDSLRHVYFPIADDQGKYIDQRRRQLRGASPEVISAIDALSPFRGGDDQIWMLHKLSIVDKHRTLILSGSAYQSLDLGSHLVRAMQREHPQFGSIAPLPVFFRPADRKFPLRVGDVLFTDLPDADVNHELEFRFDVAIGEPGIVEGAEVLSLADGMIRRVDGVFDRLKKFLR